MMFKLSKASSVFLNITRAIFAQMVLFGHTLGFLGLQARSRELRIPDMQSLAVTVFFLLSGFLTILSATNKKRANIDMGLGGKKYFIGRIIRIYSVLIPALLAITLIDLLNISLTNDAYQHLKTFNLKTFFANVLMLQNFPFLSGGLFDCQPLGSGRPLWTLPLEFFMYIIFGFFFYHTYRAVKNNVWKISCIIIIFFCLLVPYEHFIFGSANGLTFAWLVGIFVFILLDQGVAFQVSHKLWFIIALILAIVRIYRVNLAWKLNYDPLFTVLMGICLYCGIVMTENIKWNKLTIKISGFIASYSFSLYITHYSIIEIISNTMRAKYSILVRGVLMIVICNLFAILFAYVFENKLSKFLTEKLIKTGGRPGNAITAK